MPTSITISGKAQVKVKVLLKGSTTYMGWSTNRKNAEECLNLPDGWALFFVKISNLYELISWMPSLLWFYNRWNQKKDVERKFYGSTGFNSRRKRID